MSALMPEPVDPRLVNYASFLRAMDAIELSAYRGEAADVAEGVDADGKLARALLPIVDAVAVEATAREMLKAEIAEDMNDKDFAEFFETFRQIARGRRQLGLPLEGLDLLQTATETVNAARLNQRKDPE